MDFEQLLEKYFPIVKKNILVIALGVLGLIFLSYGLIVLIGGRKSSSDGIVFESGSEQGDLVSQIVVDIEGAVIRPGVYKLSYNSRLKDVLVASGGLSEHADRAWVSKNLNLAQKLNDATKIYIPKTGENTKESINVVGTTENLSKSQINVNIASIKELDALPGIGLVTAQKIIDGRPYTTIDDLLSKKVVNSRVFGGIKDKITVY